MAENEGDDPPILLPCTICCRTFRPEVLEKHAKICEKTTTKKRKVFDSSQQRIQGTDLAEFIPPIISAKKAEKTPTLSRKCDPLLKQKQQEFVRATRAAKVVDENIEKQQRPAPVVTRPSGSEQCPYCDRLFGPKSFDRHVDWCKEQRTRMPKSPASVKAKERLEARTKYRAPAVRSQRAVTREKYSPAVVRKGSFGKLRDCSPSTTYDSNISLATTVSSVSTVSRVSSSPAIQRVGGASVHQRSSSPNKRSPLIVSAVLVCSPSRRTRSLVGRTQQQRSPVITGKEHLHAARDRRPDKERPAGRPQSQDRDGRNLQVADTKECSLLTNPASPGDFFNSGKMALEADGSQSSCKSRKKVEFFELQQESGHCSNELSEFCLKTNTSNGVTKTSLNHTFDAGQSSLPLQSVKGAMAASAEQTSTTHEKSESVPGNLSNVKVNDITINSRVHGLTVTQIAMQASDDLVTWKDIVVPVDRHGDSTEISHHSGSKQGNNFTDDGSSKVKKISWQDMEQCDNAGNTSKTDILMAGESCEYINYGVNNSKLDATFTTTNAVELAGRKSSMSYDTSICNTEGNSHDSWEKQDDNSGNQFDEESRQCTAKVDSINDLHDYLQHVVTDDEKSVLRSAEILNKSHSQEENCFNLSTVSEQLGDDATAEEFEQLLNGSNVLHSGFSDESRSTICTSTPVKTRSRKILSNENNQAENPEETGRGMLGVCEDKIKLTFGSLEEGSNTNVVLPPMHHDKDLINDGKLCMSKSEQRTICSEDCDSNNEETMLTSQNFCCVQSSESFSEGCSNEKHGEFDFCGVSKCIPREKLTRYFFEKQSIHSLSNNTKHHRKFKRIYRKIGSGIDARHLDAHVLARPSSPLFSPSPVRKKLKVKGNVEVVDIAEKQDFVNFEKTPTKDNQAYESALCNSPPTILDPVEVKQHECQLNVSVASVTPADSSQPDTIVCVEEKLEERIHNSYATGGKACPKDCESPKSSHYNTQNFAKSLSASSYTVKDTGFIRNLLPKRREVDRDVDSNWHVSRYCRGCCESCKNTPVSSGSADCVHMKLSNGDILAGSRKQIHIRCSVGSMQLPVICIESQEDSCHENVGDSSTFSSRQGEWEASKRGAAKSRIPKSNFWQQHLQHTYQNFMEDSQQLEVMRKNPNLTKLPPISSCGQSSDRRSGDSYDPYVFAERQMLDLLLDESSRKMPEIPAKPIVYPTPITPVPLPTSPTSAFIKYPGPITLLQPSEPEDAVSGVGHTLQGRDVFEDLARLSSPSPAFRMRTKYRTKLEQTALSLQQSVSLFRSPVDSSRSETEEELRALFPGPRSRPIPPPVPYQDSSGGEAVNRKATVNSEDEELFPAECVSSTAHTAGNKISADSAYSSLNRRSPHVSELHNSELLTTDTMDCSLLDADPWCPSSSGSEISYLQLSTGQIIQKEVKTPIQPSASPQNSLAKLSKFCHECGTKYPVAVAKFCCECGVRRLLV